MIWANPIFRRYCRSRLRVKGLGLTMIITLIIATFIFFSTRTMAGYRMDMEMIDSERTPLVPLLVVQWILLFLFGTGQCAGGMTTEAEEGVLDYQRLAPMTPLAKVFGYLFGLPIREWVCFLATLPFTLWCLWRGQVDLVAAGAVFAVVISSAILYHLTGLVAGTVVKNRRRAFLASMGLVFVLYLLMPQIARFGFVQFQYLTALPTLAEAGPAGLPRTEGAALATAQALIDPESRPFGLNLPDWGFTLITQAVVSLTLIVMLWRRWRRNESHLLGKTWATGLFAAIQVGLIGNALPLVDSGRIFPSREMMRRYRMFEGWEPDSSEAIIMVAVVVLMSLAILWIFTAMISPSFDTQIRGWRRVKKLGRTRLLVGSDPTTGFGWTLIMALCGAVGSIWFAKGIIESHWFPGATVPWQAMLAILLVMITGGIGFQAMLEGRGKKTIVLTALFVGIVPVLIAVVMAARDDTLTTPAVWIGSLSPLLAPFLAASFIDIEGLPIEVTRVAPLAFYFWQLVGILVTIKLALGLRKKRAEVAAIASRPGTTAELTDS